MASIFQEVILNWKGRDYTVKPTMRLLNTIEQDISLSALAYRVSQGNPPLTQVATVISHFLNAAGAKSTAEEVYSEIMTGGKGCIENMVTAIMLAVFPQVGKELAPSTRKKTRSTQK